MSRLFPRSDYATEQAELNALVAAAGPETWHVAISEQQHRNIVGGNIRVPGGWRCASPEWLSRLRTNLPLARGYHGPARGPQ